MANILEFTPTGTRAKVIETKFGIMLLNNYYTKEDLQPISFYGSNFSGIQSGSNILYLKSNCILNEQVKIDFRHKENGFIVDKYIPNRYYYIFSSNYSNINANLSYIVFSNETEEDIFVDSVNQLTKNYICNKIIDVTENFIYMFVNDYNSRQNALIRMDKTSKSCIIAGYDFPLFRTKYFLICSNSNYIYYVIKASHSSYLFIKYDKNLNAIEKSTINLEYVSYNSTGTIEYENIYFNNNKYYIYQIVKDVDSNCSIIGIELNPNLDIQNSYRVFKALDYNEHIKLNDHDGYEMYRYWVKDNYLYLAIYDENYVANYNNSVSVQGIYTFKINSDSTLQYINYNQLNNEKQIISICFSSDKNMIIIGYWQSFQICIYNELNHQYEILSDSIYTNVLNAGFDEYNRIWVQEQDSAIKMYSVYDPQKININFENNVYIYEDEPISSYITFSAENFIKSPAIGLYRFELSGDAIFTDNNNKVIDKQYNGEELRINIKITSSEQLYCKVYYIKSGD